MNLSARDIIAAIPDALALADNDGKIVLANEALLALSGYGSGDLAGKPAGTLFGDEAQGEGNAVLLTKNGGRVPVELSRSPVKDAEGRQEGSILVIHDAGEIRALRERLFLVSKLAAVGRLTGGVAHELNNPLAVILGFSQCGMQGMKKDDPLYEPLDSIEKEAQRCKELIADLLAFSRAAREGLETRDINDTVNRAVSLVATRAKTKNVKVVRQYQDGIPFIPVNGNQIKEVVVHLCNNAIDAMPGGGELTVATELRDGRIAVTITDTGAGMTDEVKKHLFEPFFTTKEPAEGIGLGLAVSKEIIERHGGGIEGGSEGPGKGSRFVFTLPAGKT